VSQEVTSISRKRERPLGLDFAFWNGIGTLVKKIETSRILASGHGSRFVD
jgi:hypothetical protein